MAPASVRVGVGGWWVSGCVKNQDKYSHPRLKKKSTTHVICQRAATYNISSHASSPLRTQTPANDTPPTFRGTLLLSYLRLHELVRLPVGAHDIPPRRLEPLGQVGPDETGAASDANLHCVSPFDIK